MIYNVDENPMKEVLEVRGAPQDKRLSKLLFALMVRTNKQGGQLLRLYILANRASEKHAVFALGETFDIGTSPCR